MLKKKQIYKTLFLNLGFLSALPLVQARNSGIGAIDKGIDMLSRVFYPSSVLSNPAVQTGFFKFLYFIIIFAAANWALLKVFNKKGDDANGKRAANVIAFAFAAIAAWFMPALLAQTTAAILTALFSLLIPLGLTGVAIWFAFYKMKDEWWQHLIGVVILILAVTLLNWTLGVVG